MKHMRLKEGWPHPSPCGRDRTLVGKQWNVKLNDKLSGCGGRVDSCSQKICSKLNHLLMLTLDASFVLQDDSGRSWLSDCDTPPLYHPATNTTKSQWLSEIFWPSKTVRVLYSFCSIILCGQHKLNPFLGNLLCNYTQIKSVLWI